MFRTAISYYTKSTKINIQPKAISHNYPSVAITNTFCIVSSIFNCRELWYFRNYAVFEVLTAVAINVDIFWDVVPCSPYVMHVGFLLG
jgi:hypothetical protein